MLILYIYNLYVDKGKRLEEKILVLVSIKGAKSWLEAFFKTAYFIAQEN